MNDLEVRPNFIKIPHNVVKEQKAAEGLGVARPTLTNIVIGHTKRSLALESAGIKFVGEE